MSKASLQSIFLSIAILLISTVCGALIASKLAGGEAGWNYFWFSAIVSVLIFFSQLVCYKKARVNLLNQLFYMGFFGFTMVWFMLSLFLPVFWMDTISMLAKAIMLTISVVILSANVAHGLRSLNQQWQAIGAATFDQEFKPADSSVDWDKVVRRMNVSPNVFIPGVPQSWTPVVSVLLIVFMVVGLNLRNALPVFSVFAWGIPSTVLAGIFLQVSAAYFAQTVNIRAIEKERNVILKAVGN